jgi:hypothetical protein
LRENVGRGDGRGREMSGFALGEIRGHAESIHVARDVAPNVAPRVALDCRVSHAVQSRMLAPPSHPRVKAR